MNLPFSTEQFLDVFARYNEAVWPAQYFLNAVAVVALLLAFNDWRHAARVAAALVGVMWLWAGVAYQWSHFTHINPAAWFFGTLFVFQAAMMFRIATSANGLGFTRRWTVRRLSGVSIIVYALIVYPVLGYCLGHTYPGTPTFGAPCPVTLFTLGVLLLSDGRHTKLLFVIPLLWAMLGSIAAFQLGMKEDLGLLAAAGLSIWFAFRRGKLIGPVSELGQEMLRGQHREGSRLPPVP